MRIEEGLPIKLGSSWKRVMLRCAMLTGGVLLSLGAWGCQDQPSEAPVVVAPVKSNANNNIRICPKCYRRFFGGQERCTVDLTELIDYEAAQPVPGAATEVPPPEPNPTQNPVLSDADPAVGGPGPAVRTQLAGLPGADDVQPVKVRATGGVDRYEAPPTANGTPAPAVAAVQPWVPDEPVAKAVATPRPPPLENLATPAPLVEPPTAAPIPQTPVPEPAVAMVPKAAPISVDELLATMFADVPATTVSAQAGKLAPDQIGALASLTPSTEERFTAGRSLLAAHYKATGNSSAYGKALEDLMQVPTNQYNPTIRLEQAEYYLLNKQYQEAIEAATIAERYRQKFPKGDIYYTRLARTYEVLAKAYEGRFTGTEDPDDLDLAIRMWQRYLTHVEKKEDTKRIKMAEDNIAKLERIKERVQ